MTVVAVDQSAVGLEKAQALAAARGVHIETCVSDLATFALASHTYDGIVSIWAHLPPALRRDVHARCVAALRPGGVLLLEAYRPEQVTLGTGGPPDPMLCMQADALRDELAGLELERLVERERDINEGRHHRGRSAVVQVVARKPS